MSTILQRNRPIERYSVAVNALAYSATNLLSQSAIFIANFIIRRFLAPEVMGIWNFAVLVRDYLLAANLGTSNGAIRELPILKGQEIRSEEHMVRSVSLTSSLAEVVILGIGLWIYLLIRRDSLSTREFLSLGSLVVIMISYRLQESYTVFFQSAQLYVPLSRVFLIGNLVYASLLTLGVVIGGFEGLLLGVIAAEIIRCPLMILVGKRNGLSSSLLWNKQTWKRLASYGLIYRITDYPNTFFMRLDLLWVSMFFGLRALGLYALAKNLFTQANDITIRMGTVLFTRTLMNYGAGRDQRMIASDMKRFARFQLLISVPIICWLVASAAPYLIRHFIPLYSESIPLVLILILGSFFISQNNNLFTMWLAEKRMTSYGFSNLFGMIAVGSCLLISWYFLGRRTLLDIALTTTLGYFGYFSYMVFTAGRELWGTKGALQVFGEVALSGIWTALVIRLLGQSSSVPLKWQQDLMQSLIVSFQMFLGFTPLLIFGLWISGGGIYILRLIQGARQPAFSRS